MRALLLALAVSGCAAIQPFPRAALAVEESTQPVAYRAGVRGGGREVHGEACRNALGLPIFLWGGYDIVGWGDAGYREALGKAQESVPGATLSDVRADVRMINIVVFRRECVEVTAAAPGR